ncbi:MAG: hypothetical protein N3A72_09910 [bacterium]|nr:hypothetical protein [bacterium]
MQWLKILAILMLVLLAVLTMASCRGTVVYHEGPPGPPPGPRWVPGHWSWNGSDWIWIPGHWRP